MYQGELPQGLRVGDYIDMTLERFGNVDNLTMVPPNSDREMSGLVFLELLEYTEYPEYNDDETFGQILHPAMADMFPNMEELFERTGMWSESEWLWKQRPYSKINRSREESGNAGLGGGQKTWEEPHLQVKPIVTSKQKVEYLNSCLEFDRKRSAERVTITVAALGYNSLKFSLPLTTTLGELVSMFCRARGIVLDPVHNRAFIYTDIIGNINDCSWSHGACIHSIADGEENTRVDMFFDPPRPSQLSCDCPNVTCSHTRKYQKLHYMENEDWGIRDMFKRLENGGL
ncbi:hypothetical protein DL95DRAFT_506064 [Leptodontidium sp. 2 PMI_412]|nr:hypothetical protein DL95DRAFT_506064 [Leptodontidium sp. 2 PMI_412]